jgi:Zn-dependent peptidase ImmA (M78 family)
LKQIKKSKSIYFTENSEVISENRGLITRLQRRLVRVILRDTLGYERDQPIPRLVHGIERAGVCFLALPPMENREAFCVWLRGEGNDIPVLAASGGRSDGDRFRMSVAHELGHLVMHKSFLRKSNKEVEAEAFEFAAELLMPASAMQKELISPVTLTSLSKLKPRWGVSIAALIRRAHDLSIITTRQYHYLFHLKTALGMREREPENLVNSQFTLAPFLITVNERLCKLASSVLAGTYLFNDRLRGAL